MEICHYPNSETMFNYCPIKGLYVKISDRKITGKSIIVGRYNINDQLNNYQKHKIH